MKKMFLLYGLSLLFTFSCRNDLVEYMHGDLKIVVEQGDNWVHEFPFVFMTAVFCSHGQAPERFFYAAAIGTGFAMNEPAYTPVIVQVLGYYRFNERLMAGLGTGLSFYETTLIPVFLDAKFALRQARKFVSYLECGGGYAFAPGNKANGGLYCNPSLGVLYALSGKMKLQLSAGYEFQQYERLKKHANDYLTVEYSEKRRHHALSVKIGIIF